MHHSRSAEEFSFCCNSRQLSPTFLPSTFKLLLSLLGHFSEVGFTCPLTNFSPLPLTHSKYPELILFPIHTPERIGSLNFWTTTDIYGLSVLKCSTYELTLSLLIESLTHSTFSYISFFGTFNFDINNPANELFSLSSTVAELLIA